MKRREHSEKARQNCAEKCVWSKPTPAARAALQIGKKYGTKLHVYHCEVCGKYHLTSQTPEQALAIREHFRKQEQEPS